MVIENDVFETIVNPTEDEHKTGFPMMVLASDR